nr:hypothetical protein [uncultured Flavobacterium sp.]
MREILNKIYNNNYTNLEWNFIKIIFITLWIILASMMLYSYQTIPMPQGICKIVPCELFLDGSLKYPLILVIILVTLFYILEIKQMYTCLGLFVISTLLFTMEESNGILNRNSLFTFVFFAQFLAYLLHHYDSKSDIKKNRIQFSVQVITAGYTLSALSKLYHSGIYWIQDGKRISLQILKSHFSLFVTNGDSKIVRSGENMVQFIESNPSLVYLLLGSSLFLELFALLSIKNKKTALVYGILLTFMHLGIYIVMDIAIVSILIPMLLFMVNPLYIIWVILKSFYKKLAVDFSKFNFSKAN